MFGQSFGQSSYNYAPNNGDFNNAWGQQQQQHQVNGPSGHNNSRKGPPNDDYYRGNDRYGSARGSGGDGVKSIEQGLHGIGLDRQQKSNQQSNNLQQSSSAATKEATASVPKKMTWASIASQPAKPQIRTSSSSSTLKKKGPGMPPPPMVPGRHNMDISNWDSPKNGPVPIPVPVPSPPPPITEPSPLSQQVTKSNNNSNNSNNNSSNNATNSLNNNQEFAGWQIPKAASSNNNGANGAQNIPQSNHFNRHDGHGQSNAPIGPPGKFAELTKRDGGPPPYDRRPNWHAPNQHREDGRYDGRMHHQQQYRPNSGPGKYQLTFQIIKLF